MSATTRGDKETRSGSPDLATVVGPDGLPRALWWDEAQEALCLLDQTVLPQQVQVLSCSSLAQAAEAIRSLRVRGAPAIGVTAAYAFALGVREAAQASGSGLHPEAVPLDQWRELTHQMAVQLCATRPTAVNLGWAVDHQVGVAERIFAQGEQAVTDLPRALLVEAHRIAAEDAAACRAQGAHGAELLQDGDVVLTHCNAGALATAGIGTALAPIYTAHRAGKRLHVYVDETRPVLQGARLTAWELQCAGVPLTLITDSMAGYILARHHINAIFVGADRIAANGDVANKIGTYPLAILAREHGVPFYVVAPRSTIDLSLPTGDSIPIEERTADEVTTIGGVRIAPTGIAVANPAFDLTPARLVTGIILETGVVRAPFDQALTWAMA